MKKTLVFYVLALALIMTACSGAKAGAFPTGKFVDSGDPTTGFNFNEDGTWTAFNAVFTLARGTYRVEGNLYIEETNNSGCVAPMSYEYSFDGATLKFQPTSESINDTCDGRKQAFSNKVYVPEK